MDLKTKAQYEARAGIIKAMGHPSRLFMIEELSRGERCVCELTSMIGADISTVSKHLSMLKNVGIVKYDKRGSKIFYSLRVPCILKFLSCVEKVLQANAKDGVAMIK